MTEAPSTGRTRPGAARGPSRGVVLLIEDEPMVRDTISHMLRASQYRSLIAEDAVCALQLAADPTVEIDAVVSDVTMPDADGRLLITAIRRYRPGLPALLISGYVDGEMDAEAAGAAFLAKPFTPAEFRGVLSAIMSARAA